MTPVERARHNYVIAWLIATYTKPMTRSWEKAWLLVEARSIDIDLATAEDVARRSIAW